MKKFLKIGIVCGISLITISAFTLVYLNLRQTTDDDKKKDDDDDNPQTTPLPLVSIYVNSTIHNNISLELDQYKQHVIAQGYSVNIINWTSTNVNSLKQHIISKYSQGLVGVILVGDLPYATGRWWDQPWGVYRYFPVDLFLMDLDGLWNDADGDLIYDLTPGPTFDHSNGSGDWTPEIWLARINPSSIDNPSYNQTDLYKQFFIRDGNLRHGNTVRPHNALLYIDNDWSSYRNEWVSNFTAYNSSQLFCYSDNPTTTATNYMNNLTTVNYELVHLLCHSWAYQHMFGPNGDGSDGIITYNDVATNNTLALFYNLYACYSCNYAQKNNTGTYYLFVNTQAVTVIGSSRSGGMDLYQPFYDALAQGKTLGEAFRIWFHNPEIISLNKAYLYYGMTILGDPLCTIYMT